MNDKYIKNTFANIKREKLMSITNIFVMFLSFFLLGIFITIIAVTQTILRGLEQQAQVTIFFKDDFTEEKILNLEQTLKSDKRIFQVKYVSKAEAYKIFKDLNSGDPKLLDSVNASILPASLEVKANNLGDLPKLSGEFKSLDGVEEVSFYEDVIGRFKKFSTVAYTIGFVMILAFFIISYAIVLSTLRMVINSKGIELEIMKLVGASTAYVKMPLIYQGIFYGMTSSFFSGLFLVLLNIILTAFHILPASFGIGFLPNLSLTPMTFSFFIWFVLIVSGTLLGFFGSSFAIKRYLKY